MLAYAANRPIAAERRSSPHGFLLIATTHVLAIAVLVSVKMDLPQRIRGAPLVVDLLPPPPVPERRLDPPQRGETRARATTTDPRLPLPLPGPTVLPDPGPSVLDPPLPQLPPLPTPAGETRGPALLTPPSALRPPYPADKLALEQEASLSLRLSIDSSGRVTAVEPLGRADRSFLDAARRHLIAHWCYRPAMKDGRAVASTLLTTLHFRLDS